MDKIVWYNSCSFHRVAVFTGAGYALTRIVPTLRRVGRRDGK